MRIFLILLLVLFSSSVYAANPFSPPPSDYSLQMLGNILGAPGGGLPIPGGGNALLANIFRVFNGAVMVFGTLVLSYLVVSSAITTAKSGEVVGKKFSIWNPTRGAIGFFLMVPTSSGYSTIQVLFLWLIVNGIGAADATWNVVLDLQDTGESASVSTKDPVKVAKNLRDIYISAFTTAALTAMDDAGHSSDDIDAENVIQSLYKAAACKYIINNYHPIPQGFVDYQPDNAGRGNIIVGTQDFRGGPAFNVCGEFSLGLSNEESADRNLRSQVQSGILSALYTMENMAANALSLSSRALQANSYSENYGFLISVMRDIDDSRSKPNNSNPSVTEQAKKDGWVTAGSYHWFLVKSEAQTKTQSAPNQVAQIDLSGVPSNLQTNIQSKINKTNILYRKSEKALQDYLQRDSIVRNIQIDAADLDLDALYNATKFTTFAVPVVGPILGAMYIFGVDVLDMLFDAIIDMAQDSSQDPIVNLTRLGLKIMYSTELAVVVIIVLIIAIALIAAICSCQSASKVISDYIAPFAGALITFSMSMLWIPAAGLGLYLPLIPYFVFTFAVVGWVINVIIAITAAPIVSLTLLTPSEQSEFGKASVAFMLIFAVALKPILMIFGFIISLKLHFIAVKMLNFSFNAVIGSSVKYLTIFGSIALLTMYVGIILALTNECYSLVHIIPRKVYRWIGGQPDDGSGEEEGLQKLKGTADAGRKQVGEVGGKAMAAGLKASVGSKSSSEGKSGDGGKGGDSGGSGGSGGGG